MTYIAIIIDRERPANSFNIVDSNPFSLLCDTLNAMPEGTVELRSEVDDMQLIFDAMSGGAAEIPTWTHFDGSPTDEHRTHPERMGRIDPDGYFYNTQRYALILKGSS